MTINKFYDPQATMSGGGEQIPEAFLQDSVTASHKFAPIHQNTRAYFRAGAEWAYRHLSPSKPETWLRWVKANERFPQIEEINKIWHIKPIRDGFDLYMFLKYVQDFEKEDKPSFRWNLWDGYHAWTRKITPELLSRIEWLDESTPAEPAKESQPDIDVIKLLKWVAKVTPPEFREEKPHTLKGWRFRGKLLSTEQVSQLYFKSTGIKSPHPEPSEQSHAAARVSVLDQLPHDTGDWATDFIGMEELWKEFNIVDIHSGPVLYKYQFSILMQKVMTAIRADRKKYAEKSKEIEEWKETGRTITRIANEMLDAKQAEAQEYRKVLRTLEEGYSDNWTEFIQKHVRAVLDKYPLQSAKPRDNA